MLLGGGVMENEAKLSKLASGHPSHWTSAVDQTANPNVSDDYKGVVRFNKMFSSVHSIIACYELRIYFASGYEPR